MLIYVFDADAVKSGGGCRQVSKTRAAGPGAGPRGARGGGHRRSHCQSFSPTHSQTHSALNLILRAKP